MNQKAKFLLAALAAAGLAVSCASTGGAGGGGGTAKATAEGLGGPVTVTVTVKDGNIVSVTAEGPDETPGIGSRAIDELPAKIQAANSADVDGVSGATVTSDAIKAAAQEALSKVRKN